MSDSKSVDSNKNTHERKSTTTTTTGFRQRMYLHRTCWQMSMTTDRQRGWQNFEKKNWRGISRDSFFLKFCHPRSRFWAPKLKNVISSDYVLCYIPWALETLEKQDQVNNANSVIIFLINQWSVRIVRVVQLFRVVQVARYQSGRLSWYAFRK